MGQVLRANHAGSEPSCSPEALLNSKDALGWMLNADNDLAQTAPLNLSHCLEMEMFTQLKTPLIRLTIAMSLLLLVPMSSEASDQGIEFLIRASQQKAAQASDATLEAANGARQSIAEARAGRSNVKAVELQYAAIQKSAAHVKELEQRLRELELHLKQRPCR